MGAVDIGSSESLERKIESDNYRIRKIILSDASSILISDLDIVKLLCTAKVASYFELLTNINIVRVQNGYATIIPIFYNV